jgi:environmental stress-induced protein Ves
LTLQLLRAAHRAAMPWKNGGGITCEVATWPPDAGLDAFDWRISIAEVAASGPFSSFPGVDRILTVIAGSGLRLRVADRAPVTLDATAPPHAFPGDVACTAELAGGPIRDLNVMVRRAAARTRVRRLEVATPTSVKASAAHTLVVVLDPLIGDSLRLNPEDAVVLARGQSLALDGRGRALLIELDPLAGL